eukprot:5749276-Lingulodinium_polyedra.AAC.1
MRSIYKQSQSGPHPGRAQWACRLNTGLICICGWLGPKTKEAQWGTRTKRKAQRHRDTETQRR